MPNAVATALIRLLASFNSRFTVVQLADELRLYRGGSSQSEPTLAWSRSFDMASAGDLNAVGNQGDIFFQGSDGLFRLRNHRTSPLEAISEVCSVARAENGGELGKVSVDAPGREVLYEHITPSAGIKGRIQKLFQKNAASGSQQVHNLHHLHLDRKEVGFYKFTVESELARKFRWNVSPTCRYIAAALPDKKDLFHVQLIDIIDEAVTEDFDVTGHHLGGVWVLDSGVLLVDIRQEGADRLIIGRQHGRSTPSAFSPPPGYRVLHFGSSFVAVGYQSRLHLYNFDGKLLADLDVAPLDSEGLPFHFHFNDMGGISVLVWAQDKLIGYHSDAKSLIADAQNWPLLARPALVAVAESPPASERHPETVVEAEPELVPEVVAESPFAPPEPEPEPPVEPELAIPEIVAAPLHPSDLPDWLAEGPVVEPPPPPAVGQFDLPAVEEALEKLRMRFIAGDLSREEFFAQRAPLEALRATALSETPQVSAPRRLELGG